MSRRAAAASGKSTVKKTFNLPPELVARVKRGFHAKTETEAVIQALQRAADDDEIYAAIRRVSGRLPGFQGPR